MHSVLEPAWTFAYQRCSLTSPHWRLVFGIACVICCACVCVFASSPADCEAENNVRVMNMEFTEAAVLNINSVWLSKVSSHQTFLQGHITELPKHLYTSFPSGPHSPFHLIISALCSQTFFELHCTALSIENQYLPSYGNPFILFTFVCLLTRIHFVLSSRHGVWEGDPDPSHQRGGFRSLRPDDGGNRDGLLAVFSCPHLQQHSERHPGWSP